MVAYSRAVELLREHGDTERLAGVLMRIGLTHQTAFDHQRAQRAFDEAFGLRPASDSSSSGHAVGSTTLRLVSAEPESFDPQLAGGWPALSSLLFSGLMRYDEGAQLVPDVAQRWEISGDGRRYTFALREGVTWNDGVPVTARDFAYAYRRALDPATMAEASVLLLPVAGAREVQAGSAPAEEAGIHAVDDRTLVIELAEPTSYFMYNLAHVTLAPLPHHVLNIHGRNWWRPETIVSNGPFQMAAWEPGHNLALERNPNYHGPVSGNVQRLSLKFTGPWDPVHERLYRDDEVDALAFSLSTSLNVIDRLRHLFPHEHASPGGSFVTSSYWVDPEAPPLDDRRLRQAMAMAINRVAVAKNYHPSAAATGGFVPPGIPGHVPGIATPYDPHRAAAIVADILGPDAPPLTFIGMKAAEALIRHLVDQWQAVGLAVDVRLFENVSDRWQAWREASSPKVSVGGWTADYPDPDTFLRVAINDFLPHWRHNRYESTLQKASRATDPTRRLELYREAEHILVDEAVLVPLVYQAEHLMIKPWVTTFPNVPSYEYLGFLKDVIIGPHEGAS
jgi:oligopeptide transport system substrate-binding protein